MLLSIIIINYNTANYTINCVRSIYEESDGLDLEIIVIDNNSQKEDPRNIKTEFPRIELILNTENQGFGIANNQGISLAKGKYILLLNSDTLILDDAITKSIDFMESDFATSQNIGLLGCTLLNTDGTNQQSTFGKESFWRYLVNTNPFLNKFNKLNSKTSFDFDSPQSVEGVSGAFMLFRRKVFDVIKPFDPDIFMYSEETELCRNRVSKHFSIYYWPGARIIHYGGKADDSIAMYHQNMLSYSLTWWKKGALKYIGYLAVTMVHFISYVLLFPLAAINASSRRIYKKVIIGYLKIAPYLFVDIPAYSRSWGSRPHPLKLKRWAK